MKSASTVGRHFKPMLKGLKPVLIAHQIDTEVPLVPEVRACMSIPRQADHRFRGKPTTDSEASRPVFGVPVGMVVGLVGMGVQATVDWPFFVLLLTSYRPLLANNDEEEPMAARRAPMRKIREILRMLWCLNFGLRKTARACRLSHSTVSEYRRRAEDAELSWEEVEQMDSGTLERRLFPLGDSPSRPHHSQQHLNFEVREADGRGAAAPEIR